MEEARNKIIPKYSSVPEELTKEEFTYLYNFLIKFWYLYGFTEFPYHNLAYQKMLETNNQTMKEHLDDNYEAKVEGRKIMNCFFFVDGVMPNVVKYFSRKYFGDEETANYLFYEELLDLFDGKKPSKEIIKQRKECIAVLSLKREILKIPHEMGLELAEKFIKIKPSDSLKGTIANKGRVTGEVVIAPMLNNTEAVNKVIAKMKEGAILVAQTTSPEIMCLCNKAAAIVADQGGMLSHAAIVSRELGIPCLVGTEYATEIFKDGDLVEVDANQGIVRKIG